jgi:hypothetical protein
MESTWRRHPRLRWGGRHRGRNRPRRLGFILQISNLALFVYWSCSLRYLSTVFWIICD